MTKLGAYSSDNPTQKTIVNAQRVVVLVKQGLSHSQIAVKLGEEGSFGRGGKQYTEAAVSGLAAFAKRAGLVDGVKPSPNGAAAEEARDQETLELIEMVLMTGGNPANKLDRIRRFVAE